MSRIASLKRGGRVLVPLIAVLVLAAPVAAGQPVTQQLDPAPSDIYTCTAIGSGTVCHAQVVEVLDPAPTGIWCDGAGDPFEIWDQATRTLDATRWYDTDGRLVTRIRINSFAQARLSNPAAGTSVSYQQRDRDVEHFAIPADLDSATLYSENKLVAVVPGAGAVLVESGRFVATGDEVLQLVGRRDLSAFFAGDPAALDSLCAALAG
jgi:hypothetical protein